MEVGGGQGENEDIHGDAGGGAKWGWREVVSCGFHFEAGTNRSLNAAGSSHL